MILYVYIYTYRQYTLNDTTSVFNRIIQLDLTLRRKSERLVHDYR